jgi:RNA polymerase sigma factor (sigma-70 family)
VPENLHGGVRVLHWMSPDRDTTRLYEQYGRELYRFCLARLRSPEEAEDAVQNTFLRVVRALEAGAEPEFESAWLYRIAANVCLSRQALAGRRAQWQTTEELERLPLAAPETDPATRRELIDAVASLPKNQRDAILLREWQGLSYAEIAESLDTSVPAVETLLVRARRQLAALLRSRTRGGVLDGLLLLRLRAWLTAASPAQIAAGAAVVALGSGVVSGADVSAADTHRPAAAPAAAVAATAGTAPHQVVPHVHHVAVAPLAPPTVHRASVPQPVAARAEVPTAAVRAPVSKPTSMPAPPRPAPPAKSPAGTPPHLTTQPAPARSGGRPTLPLSAASTPAVTLPAAPTVTTPAAPVPVGSIELPPPSVPAPAAAPAVTVAAGAPVIPSLVP